MSESDNSDIMDTLREQVNSHNILLYMKGSPQAPQCGFSAQTVQCLMSCGERFAYVNILSDPEIFENLPRFQNWPTFPQIYINGELIGGCDITLELYQKGELQKMVKEAVSGAGGKPEEEAS